MKDKVYLIYPPFNFVGMPPLGLAYLKSALEVSGFFGVEIIDLNIEFYQYCIDLVMEGKLDSSITSDWNTGAYWYRHCVAAILFGTTDNLKEGIRPFAELAKRFFRSFLDDFLQLKPSVVGISVTDSSFMSALYLANKIKATSPRVHIVFGGPLMIRPFVLHYLKEFPFVDSIVCGEAEISFVELVQGIREGQKELNYISRVYSRNGQSLPTEESKLVEVLDDLPYPDFSGLTLSDYVGRYYPDIRGKPTLPILASRGCPWGKCTFCSDPFIWKGYRYRSPRSVVEEILYQSSKHKVYNFMFCDLSISGNFEQLENMCDLLINSNRDIIWECMSRVTQIPGRILNKMNMAGCRAIFLGVESVSDSILRRMKKGSSKQLNVQMMKKTIQNKIFLRFNLITGFPGESISDIIETLDFLNENESWLKGNCEIFLSPCTLTYGSPMWNDQKSFSVSVGPARYQNAIPMEIQKRIPFYEYKLISDAPDGREERRRKRNLWKEIRSILWDWNGAFGECRKKEYYLDLKDFLVIHQESCMILLDDDVSRLLFLCIAENGKKTKREVLKHFHSYDLSFVLKKIRQLADLGIVRVVGQSLCSDIPHWVHDAE